RHCRHQPGPAWKHIREHPVAYDIGDGDYADGKHRESKRGKDLCRNRRKTNKDIISRIEHLAECPLRAPFAPRLLIVGDDGLIESRPGDKCKRDPGLLPKPADTLEHDTIDQEEAPGLEQRVARHGVAADKRFEQPRAHAPPAAVRARSAGSPHDVLALPPL